MIFNEAINRWNWINGFITAALHAAIVDLGKRVNNELTFRTFIDEYVKILKNRLASVKIPSFKIDQDHLRYIFHLESEIWGENCDNYYYFFPRNEGSTHILQTFHFAISFFTIERCLNLFLSPSKSQFKGRKGRRRDLFGKDNGLFSVRYPQFVEVMGAPFYLSANTRNLLIPQSRQESWQSLHKTQIPDPLKKFYSAVCHNSHFTNVLERAFVNTRKTHLPISLKEGRNKRLPLNVRSWWYDVLWKYSESIRYNALVPSQIIQQQPYYWNRNIRWFTSLTLTGLLLILSENNSLINGEWKNAISSNHILKKIWDCIVRF